VIWHITQSLQHVDEEDKQACHKGVNAIAVDIHVLANEKGDVYPNNLNTHNQNKKINKLKKNKVYNNINVGKPHLDM
jgi:hypothetical protein